MTVIIVIILILAPLTSGAHGHMPHADHPSYATDPKPQ